MNNCYYEVLGIHPSADLEAIRAAYRSLSQRFHPDKNPGCSAATSRMQQINEAYRALSSSVTRDEYDGGVYEEPHVNSEDFVWVRPVVRRRPFWKKCVSGAIYGLLAYGPSAVFGLMFLE